MRQQKQFIFIHFSQLMFFQSTDWTAKLPMRCFVCRFSIGLKWENRLAKSEPTTKHMPQSLLKHQKPVHNTSFIDKSFTVYYVLPKIILMLAAFAIDAID